MADNITEADERIIQLLAALNSTLDSYTVSQESDTSDDLANQLSSTALIVSVVALVVALLQAALEYVSSNSEQRNKCDTGAIGVYARLCDEGRWSWRHWRRQYFYPELDLNLLSVCSSFHDPQSSEVGQVFKGLRRLVTPRLENCEEIVLSNHEKREFYGWRHYQGIDLRWANFVTNGSYGLVRLGYSGSNEVYSWDLPLKYRLKWFYYRISHGPTNGTMPRATWAQLLTLLNVDPDLFKHRRMIRFVDANYIPSSLDVPTQKVTLTNLGCFAFLLGFRHVKIDTKAREILATGEIGTITTETMPGFGAVVRLQVSSLRPQRLVVEPSRYEMISYCGQLLGSFNFNGSVGLETLRYSSLRDNFVKSRYLDARCATIGEEVNLWLEITTNGCNHGRSDASDINLCLECLAVWQPLTGGRSWPTILLAASAASIPRITTGFPSSVLLGPFLRVFQHLAHTLSASRGVVWSQYIMETLREGTLVLKLLQDDLYKVIGHSPQYLTWGHDSKHGYLSWMQNPCGPGDIKLIEKILLGEPFDPIIAESLTEGRLFPFTVDLFDNFDPVPWAAAIRDQKAPEVDPRLMTANEGDRGGWRNHVEPHNILWTQTFLLDLAITKSRYRHKIPIGCVTAALVESWEEPISKATTPLQNLHQFLHRKASTDQTSEESPEETEEFRKLANMIKARMLCYIAYMMIIPDSTSVYRASLEDPVVLPMI